MENRYEELVHFKDLLSQKGYFQFHGNSRERNNLPTNELDSGNSRERKVDFGKNSSRVIPRQVMDLYNQINNMQLAFAYFMDFCEKVKNYYSNFYKFV